MRRIHPAAHLLLFATLCTGAGFAQAASQDNTDTHGVPVESSRQMKSDQQALKAQGKFDKRQRKADKKAAKEKAKAARYAKRAEKHQDKAAKDLDKVNGPQ